MPTSSEINQRVQKVLADTVSQVSSLFMKLSESVNSASSLTDIRGHVDALFKTFVESQRAISSEINALLDQHEQSVRRLSQLMEEKRRLEVLYTSGILFSSETEAQSLLQQALEVIVNEMHADEGFIVLCDNQGTTEAIYSRNMDPADHPRAVEMSTSVIRDTISRSQPVKNSTMNDTEFSRQNSVIRLGITAVLCVPLILESKVLGAVYLDRRNSNHPFEESDLGFLLSFAKQIVRGIETSREISTLQSKLVSEASMRFSDLRREFVCPDIIGSSRKLFEVLKIASKIAPTEAPVLLLGENGTGKDVLAQAIHQNSRRSTKPFVVINCGAIPHDLLESELFGYESGAFTGATKSKPGRLELAQGGTVFFDEIGELTVNLQAKLLRVIQTREVERLGGSGKIFIDVRFIAATNRNIAEMISAGSFREDLYYRLKVIELTMPLLRERREDIEELSAYFLKKYSPQGSTFTLTDGGLEALERYSWPGNIRELENVIHRCIVLARNSTIDLNDLPAEILESNIHDQSISIGKTLLDAETEFRRLYILKTLRRSGSVAEAAKELGINRTHFYKLLNQLDIEY